MCVTSPTGVAELFARLAAAGLDARALAGRTVAAIGPGTAAALAAHGIRADVVPARSVAEGLVAALDGLPVRRALVVRGREGRDVLPDALRERGAEVDLALLYETVPEPLDDAALAAARDADYVVFTSASTVRFFTAAAGAEALAGVRVASIGPATSAVLRELGAEPAIEADPHTPDGLIAALVADGPRRCRAGSDPPGGAVPARRDPAAGSLEPQLGGPGPVLGQVELEGRERRLAERETGGRLGRGFEHGHALAPAAGR